ncbi:50S ribosomal protein L24 [Candidatus Pacearchaeota archaeon RBG_19FT_COMBO_34_9]|nr:50S ribosomal protein L24, large subunit ribosomal protein L24 [uncultured archaeon]OGJ13069.1 MAG: 50S ribosomal protein L24 [Candidatus Pacearchaeota archaeon RBG_19FT_COMBO_34_9]OGJ16182.1 MAG: 50S ribosomal protein L24 [Candidatus Pacearchaeota archaeon RBG_13_33_26]
MKNKFSKHWKSSKRPSKQRKYTANAPLHIKKKLLSANLSKELRKKYGRRNIPARKGDTVRIMTGKLRKKQGKIIRINTKKSRVEIEGIQIKKQDGSKVNVKLHPSNLQIIELNLDDKKRIQIKEAKKQGSEQVQEKKK